MITYHRYSRTVAQSHIGFITAPRGIVRYSWCQHSWGARRSTSRMFNLFLRSIQLNRLLTEIQKIDQALRKACESIIFECTQFACRILLPWLPPSYTFVSSSFTEATTAVTASSGSSSASTRLPPERTDQLFYESCTRDLRNAFAKIRLYLDSDGINLGGNGSGGTVGVLVHHVRERVVEAYQEFLNSTSNAAIVAEERGGDDAGELMGVVKLGVVLSEVLNEVEDSGKMSVTSR